MQWMCASGIAAWLFEWRVMIREAKAADFEILIAIERAAGEAFRNIQMGVVADDPPPTVEGLALFLESGMAWVETDRDDVPVAYLLVEELDRRGHIEQVTVHPAYARRGLGAALIQRAAQWAAGRRLDGLSLTTFADVPWNAPYYSRLGFTMLPEHAWTAGLRKRVADEAAHGFGAWPRVVMVRDGTTDATVINRFG